MNEFISKHSALFIRPSAPLDYNNLFEKSILNNATFFSQSLINDLVIEESKRDTSVIFEQEGQRLRTMSSGEGKVAVLNYLISKGTQYLFVENFYDNLDASNQIKLEVLISEFSKQAIIIQIIKKEGELFSFISDYYTVVKSKRTKLLDIPTSFFHKNSLLFSELNIPESTHSYLYDYKSFVKLSNVTIKFFDKIVLSNINWEIKLGEFWQLIGENGSGKTTLLSLITGDSHKAYGKDIILFDKRKGTEDNIWEIKQKIGYFTPNITELFNRRHSVLHMVLSGFYDSIGLYVKPLDKHIKIAHKWLALIGMSDKSSVTFCTLPLAEQRMVLISRAMVKHPPLLILDEPTSGLSTESTELIVSLINKISKETKTTIIYVSHSLEKGLIAHKKYKLSKTANGSIGEVL